MPELILPGSFLALLYPLRPAFSDASFDNFCVLIAGHLHALGHHRLTDALRVFGPAVPKHFSAYYRFISHAQWSLDHLGFLLLDLAISLLGLGELQLVLDDTLTRRTGRTVALAGMHKDPLLKNKGGMPFLSFGHVFVVLSVHIRLPAIAPTGWALPFLFRLYVPRNKGGRKPGPSDRRRQLARRRKGKARRDRGRRDDDDDAYRKKTELATDLILAVAKRYPALRIVVAADHLYNGRGVLHPVIHATGNVVILAQGRANAALFDPPPKRHKGTKGRPRVKGERLLSPSDWADAHPEAFERRIVHIYGRAVPVLVASYTGIAHQSLPKHLLRYLIVRDPDGIYQTKYLLCTDPHMDPVEGVERYACRWPLERTFQDCKQLLGLEQTQTQLPTAVRRAAPLQMLLYSLIVLWYVTHGHQAGLNGRLRDDRWYRREARPSFTEMRAALRRQGWASLTSGDSGLDPPGQQLWQNYLDRVVAAA